MSTTALARRVRLSLFAGLVCFHALAHAQRPGTGQDYYAALVDTKIHSGWGTLLQTVEANHMPNLMQNIRNRQYEYAYAEIAFILREFPNHPRVLVALTQVCQVWKSPKCDFETRFADAIAVNPKAAGTYVVLGIHRLRYNQPKRAVESLKQAIEIDPNSVNAHYNIGLAYVDLKDYAKANEHARIAYELGAPLPGLRDKLKRAGQWHPASASAAEARPGEKKE